VELRETSNSTKHLNKKKNYNEILKPDRRPPTLLKKTPPPPPERRPTKPLP
jgi:hypothetical protein